MEQFPQFLWLRRSSVASNWWTPCWVWISHWVWQWWQFRIRRGWWQWFKNLCVADLDIQLFCAPCFHWCCDCWWRTSACGERCRNSLWTWVGCHHQSLFNLGARWGSGHLQIKPQTRLKGSHSNAESRKKYRCHLRLNRLNWNDLKWMDFYLWLSHFISKLTWGALLLFDLSHNHHWLQASAMLYCTWSHTWPRLPPDLSCEALLVSTMRAVRASVYCVWHHIIILYHIISYTVWYWYHMGNWLYMFTVFTWCNIPHYFAGPIHDSNINIFPRTSRIQNIIWCTFNIFPRFCCWGKKVQINPP